MQLKLPKHFELSLIKNKIAFFVSSFSHLQLRKKIALLTVALTFFVGIVFLFQQLEPFSKAQKPKEFVVSEVFPDDTMSNIDISSQPTIVFSKKLSITDSQIEHYISISPRPQGHWHLEHNKQVIYFSSDQTAVDSLPNILSYSTTYTIHIKKNIPSEDKKELKNDTTIVFKTQQNPLFTLSTSTKLLSIKPNTQSKVTFSQDTTSLQSTPNTSFTTPIQFTVSIKTASINQLLGYLSYKNNQQPTYDLSLNNSNKEVTSFQTTLPTDDYSQSTLVLPPFQKAGLYVVEVKNTYGSLAYFVNVSNHINQVFIDSKNLTVWTTDQDGKSLSGVKTSYYSLQNTPKVLSTSETDLQGLSTLTNKQTIDLVITQIHNDVAVTKVSSNRETFATDYSVFSYSDRPIYKPGDTTHYKAIIRAENGGTYTMPKEKLYIRLLSAYQDVADKDNDLYKEVSVDQNGTVTKDFKVPQTVLEASPQIDLAIKDGSSYTIVNSLYLTIQSYKKPDFSISATADKNEYISKDTDNTTITAKTLYNTPLTNTAFSYRVLVNNYAEVKDRTGENIDPTFSYYGGGSVLTQGQGTFGSKGKADISFSTDLSKFEDSQVAVVEITPHLGASPSIARTAQLIHRGEYALFFDSVTSSTKSGILGTVSALTHDTVRKPLAGKTVTISLYQGSNGDVNQKLLDTKQVTTNENGEAPISFAANKEGTYELVATSVDSRNNTITVRYPLYVSSKTYSASSQPKNTLSITTDKDSYLPQETATITVSSTAPLHDAIIAVTTSNGSYANNTALLFQKKTVNESSFTFSFPIPKNQYNNLGVSVFSVVNGSVVNQSQPLTTATKIFYSLS